MKSKMIACLLCLQQKLNHIRLFSKRGLELNCSSIIAKHFWFKPNVIKNPKERICLVCWRIVREFHQFYESVAEAHNYLDCYEFNTTDNQLNAVVLANEQNDPLPTFINSEGTSNEQCLAVEIKKQINDLELTPKIEIVQTGRAIRAKRRELKAEVWNQQPARSENENNFCDSIIGCSEIEFPLSQNDSKSSKQKRRSCQQKKKPTEKVKDKHEINHESSHSSEDKTERTSLDGFNLDEEHDVPFITENAISDSDSLSDVEPLERFAEIVPTRFLDKPKRYRKRIRPTVPYRRMKEEEIELKRLQQENYDKIIAKFFDNFPCPKCNLLVCNFGEMRKHFNLEHNANRPSVICCGRRFPLRKTLAEHVLVHLNPKHFKCSKCEQFFNDSTLLKQHEKSHTETTSEEKQTFDCHICAKNLSSKNSLKEHLAIRHKPKTEYEYTCEECTKKFPTKSIFKKHMRASHRAGGVLMCEKCGKSMRSKGALRYHIQNEHMDMPRPRPARVECPICKKSLRDESTLKLHIISIHEESGGEYRCHICGYLSVNARSLKRHIGYNHEAERKFKCTMCEKAFKRSHCLKEHISTHTGEGLYTCPECLMTFACKANFHKHKQRRHGFIPAKRNLIGLAEKKRLKLNATTIEQEEHSLCNSKETNNE